jgi:integrase
MALYKRGGVYWVSFTDPQGRRVQRSTGTKDRQAAQELHDKLKADAWRIAKLGEKPRRSWQEAVMRYLSETGHKATHEDDKAHLRWVRPHLDGKYLDEIGRDLLDRITTDRAAGGVSNATVNRTLEVVRAVLRKAVHEWEWAERVPKVRMLPEPKRRVRFLTHEEADRLLVELPAHLAEMARFSLATGLRERNVTHLTWDQVDLERRHAFIHADQAKARKPIAVPLNADALEVLRRQQGKHAARVFTYTPRSKKGKPSPTPRPVDKANTKAWREALKRAGIADFRWHDLRHCWASWHVQSGTPLHVLQELGSWESVEMVRRYGHLTSDHLREHAERIARPREVPAGDTIATVA